MTYRITCVCLGNICRSPMAAAVLNDRVERAGLAEWVSVDSAGTSHWHIGEPADVRAQATLQAAGYEHGHRARQFEPEWFAGSDLILAMDQSNLDNLRDLARSNGHAAENVRLIRSFDASASRDAEVPDPYYGGADGFTEVLAMIERACDGVVEHVQETLGPK